MTRADSLKPSHEPVGTAQIADALVTLGFPIRRLPGALVPLRPGSRVSGHARPARHFGSVDVFLEALELSAPGEVLVIDNSGRPDEGCIGDLITREVALAGLTGIVVYGAHRDTAELRELKLPIWSLGPCPVGPVRVDRRTPGALDYVLIDRHRVTIGDWVIGDDDGVLVIPAEQYRLVARAADEIQQRELTQAEAMRQGARLRDQLQFRRYLTEREHDSELTFRRHLRRIGGAVET